MAVEPGVGGDAVDTTTGLLQLAVISPTVSVIRLLIAAVVLVTLPNPASPLVSIRLQFDAGSIHDPKGKEGLAALTPMMVSQASTQKRSYTDLLEPLSPLAASIAG